MVNAGEDRPVMVTEGGEFAVLLGDVFHAVDTDMMGKLGVTHYLCTAKRCRYPPSSGPRKVLTVPLPENGECDLTLPGDYHSDGYEPISATRFDQYMDFFNDAKTSGGKVLVHCSNGKNRSAAIVLAWLVHGEGMTLKQAAERLQERRPDADVCGAFWEQLRKLD
eukprot:CAMPEP_0118923110 /NCGR_PEP_ID=MMETSP1169-20130426/1761_1 /TAXON_ID=36882 /ORGANISM="Pyramimonas obovata, Strain CCMP722" /LENGTH=164 /DNA_ID=CAMNT_0006864053 /DNA_START=128 /DNA_END=619 /DNA_ORIENTATION=+